MKTKNLIQVIEESIAITLRNSGGRDIQDTVSWANQEGVLLSPNEAQYIVGILKTIGTKTKEKLKHNEIHDLRENGYYWTSDSEGLLWGISEWVGQEWFDFGSPDPKAYDYYPNVAKIRITKDDVICPYFGSCKRKQQLTWNGGGCETNLRCKYKEIKK